GPPGRAAGSGPGFAQPIGLGLHAGTQIPETQHPEGVADLAQQLYLGGELLRLTGTAAHEDIEHVLDLAEVLADRRGDRLHEFHGGGGETLTLLLDALIDGEQLGQSDRGAHRAYPAARGLGAPDVVKEVVEQLHGRGLGVASLALLVEAADLTIGEAEQALDRLAALEPVLLQRLDDRADHPPQLEHRLAGGHTLELAGNRTQDL